MIDWPKEPSGSSAEANWFRKLLRKVRSIELKQGAGYRIKPSPNGGFFLDMNSPERASGTSSPGEFKMFQITEIPIPEEGDDFSDYVIAREWDGANLGSVDVSIAKHPYWRPSITELSVGLITYFFQYDDDNSRTVVTGAAGDTPDFTINPTYQQLIMPYEVDTYSPANGGHLGTLFAAKPANGTGVGTALRPVEWIDLTPRYWARYTPGT